MDDDITTFLKKETDKLRGLTMPRVEKGAQAGKVAKGSGPKRDAFVRKGLKAFIRRHDKLMEQMRERD